MKGQNGFYREEDQIRPKVFITPPASLLNETPGLAEILERRREERRNSFVGTYKKLLISYVFFIIILYLLGSYPYFISSFFYSFIVFFGVKGMAEAFTALVPFVSSVIKTSVMFVPLFIFYLSERKKIKDVARPQPLKLSRIPVSFIFSVGMIFIINIVISVVTGTLYGNESDRYEMPTDTAGVIYVFFSTAIVPAFFEEFIFRHVILRSLLPYNKLFAILCSALLFGLAHFSMNQNLFAVFFGIIAGFIYVKTESVFPGIILHMLNNAFSVLQTYASQYFSEAFNNDIAAFIVITVYLSLFISIFYIFNYKASPFYIGGKKFGSIVLTSNELSDGVFGSAITYCFIVFYLIAAAVMLR